jgi:hypothetical protein
MSSLSSRAHVVLSEAKDLLPVKNKQVLRSGQDDKRSAR